MNKPINNTLVYRKKDTQSHPLGYVPDGVTQHFATIEDLDTIRGTVKKILQFIVTKHSS
jgi:hypothetical protein